MLDPDSLEAGSAEKLSGPLDPPPIVQDAVFGRITEEGPNYRNVSTHSLTVATSAQRSNNG